MSGHPSWIKVRVPTPSQSAGMAEMRDLLARHDLETVCQGAQCPNAVECWSARTATFMVLGDTCTRGCRFCDVPTGNPRGILDETEPQRLAAAVRELGLNYVVLTSVDRDDVPDSGAEAFAQCVEAITAASADVVIEVLIPDFGGDIKALDRMISTKAEVFGHNLETVRRLTPALRDRRAGYDQSLSVLQWPIYVQQASLCLRWDSTYSLLLQLFPWIDLYLQKNLRGLKPMLEIWDSKPWSLAPWCVVRIMRQPPMTRHEATR